MNKTKSRLYVCIGGGLGKTLLKKIPIRAAGALLFAAALVFTSCSNDSGSGVPQAPFVEGGASLILSSDKPNIKVTATTSDGLDITVEGCNEATLTSGTETDLHANGTLVILKGKITELTCCENKLIALNVRGCSALEYLDCDDNQLAVLNVQECSALQSLYCSDNQLATLNVQGLTALNRLDCYENQLAALNVRGCSALKTLYCDCNQLAAAAFKKLFDDLPTRDAGDNAKCYLYSEDPGVTEGNHTDFTVPDALKNAFETAKTDKKWTMYKYDADGNAQEI
ncbi:leucine-rich repeat domain-containing protein [Treponema sp. SP13]|uniref:leucine-rich repeat domain-containing protein n=1 Tax=Treponema sp. SP13 TaxID=2789742 RepID=UPI003D902144